MRDRHETRIYGFNERFLFMTILWETGRLAGDMSKTDECPIYEGILIRNANVLNSCLYLISFKSLFTNCLFNLHGFTIKRYSNR